MVIVDSDILIQYSRHDDKAAAWLDKTYEHSKLAISVITEIELMIGSRDKVHLNEVRRFLSRFEIIHIDEEISRFASGLIEKYCLSHRLLLPDALIAATAIVNDTELATINRKDFRYIRDLKLADYP
ncbi:MAG: type II toxin-antitoxin system VapC family toxin [Pyrinomonadaceae bacterium]